MPRVIATDKLRSYRAAHREVMPRVEHRRSKYLNNRVENSHQLTGSRKTLCRPDVPSTFALGDLNPGDGENVPGGPDGRLAAVCRPCAPHPQELPGGARNHGTSPTR
ncbi:hypothetical protein GCM10010421_23120 [Streptomyces glaucus]|uniref:DDE domain-containing protein n=1 Tax=Streptomyces glaucus TaxID=284029 RepID=A0ABP5WU98_9ACTN